MDKTILKNAWILSAMLFFFSILLAFLVQLIVFFLGIKSSSLSSISGVMVAFILGQIYVSQFKEVMSPQLKLRVSSIYALVQIIVGVLYGIIFISTDVFLFGALVIGVTLLYAALIYVSLGLGSQSYVRMLEKSKSTSSPAGRHSIPASKKKQR